VPPVLITSYTSSFLMVAALVFVEAQAGASNPAADFCEEGGHTFVTVDDAKGEHAKCMLSNGDMLDAWEHFRNSHRADVVQVANPAAEFCERSGGSYHVKKSSSGDAVGFCTLPGGGEKDAWQLFREAHG